MHAVDHYRSSSSICRSGSLSSTGGGGVVGERPPDSRRLNSAGEFRFSTPRTASSHPMLHGVVLMHSMLGAVIGRRYSSHVPSFAAPLWSGSRVSLGNVFDVVPVNPSSAETALSPIRSRFLPRSVKRIIDSKTCVFRPIRLLLRIASSHHPTTPSPAQVVVNVVFS